jgi:hypothetical protein
MAFFVVGDTGFLLAGLGLVNGEPAVDGVVAACRLKSARSQGSTRPEPRLDQERHPQPGTETSGGDAMSDANRGFGRTDLLRSLTADGARMLVRMQVKVAHVESPEGG